MADTGEKSALRLTALFGRDELGSQAFISDDLLGNVGQKLIDDGNENTSAEQDPRDDQVRFSKKTDSQITE